MIFVISYNCVTVAFVFFSQTIESCSCTFLYPLAHGDRSTRHHVLDLEDIVNPQVHNEIQKAKKEEHCHHGQLEASTNSLHRIQPCQSLIIGPKKRCMDLFWNHWNCPNG